jgi:NADH-ubiquinone oxidoreductase chain 6
MRARKNLARVSKHQAMKIMILDILAIGSILSSVLVITSKNPVIAVIFLIAVFVNTSGYLILLGIGFIGISYIIVYIGAVMVLFLFVIMMINIKLTDILETGTQYTKNLPLALAIGILFMFEIYIIMPFTMNNVSGLSYLLDILTNLNGLLALAADASLNLPVAQVFNSFNDLSLADITFTNFLQIEAIGQGLYTYGAILLIILSAILLLSMIAPIFISTSTSARQQ